MFSRFDTIPAVTDTHPASYGNVAGWLGGCQPASHVAVAITLNAKVSSLKTKYDIVNSVKNKVESHICDCWMLSARLCLLLPAT